MKMTLRTTALVLGATALLLSACERPTTTEVEVGGKGGNATLKVTPQHHSENIDSCTIHIKYNVLEKPATHNYDEEVKCVMENGKPVATFSNLKKGNYYIYGEGWDPDIDQGVVGGIPYTITEEKTININVPVTEGD